MSNASGSKTTVAFVAETTWGTTPGTPTLQAIPFKTFALKAPVESYSSGMITPDRQKKQVALGVFNCTADVTAEMFPGVFDAFFESVCCGAWASDILKIGTTPKFFTFQEGHSDATRFRFGRGMICNKFSFSLKSGFVEVGLGFAGKAMALGTATLGTVTSVPENHPRTAISATITEGGSALATVTQLDFTVENMVDLAKPANASSPSGYGIGMTSIKGKLTAYFTDDAQLTKFLAGTPSSLAVSVGTVGEGIYNFSLPAIVYTGGDSPVDKEGLLATSLDFEAIYDPSSDSALVIER